MGTEHSRPASAKILVSAMMLIFFLGLCPAESRAVPNEGGDGGTTSTGYRTATSVGPGEQGLNGGAATVLPDAFTGTLSTAIPIDVPPGRNGLAPSLRLSYNSSGGNGWVGLGWELEPGAIERDTKGGVDYDADAYVFRMNGSRVDLVNIGGDEYRAKIEGAFTRIQKVDDYWVATDKTGRRYTFGQTTGSRQDSSVTNGRGDITTYQTFKWCLNRVDDPNGNYITLSYFKDTIESGGGGGGWGGGGGGGSGGGGSGSTSRNVGIYLARIDYTGNGSRAPTNAVLFHLESRPDPSDLYVPNFLVRTSYRLKTIAILTNNALMRAYQLSYVDNNVPPRSLLSSVRQFGKDAVLDSAGAVISGSSLPPTTVSYSSAPNTFGDTPLWLNKLNADGSATYNARDEYTGDFNGDGRTDWMYLGSDGWHVALSAGGRFAAPVKWLDRISTDGFYTYSHVLDHDDGPVVNTQFPGDFNGDGKTDWMYLRTLCTFLGTTTGDPTLCTPSTYIKGGWYVALSTGTSFAPPTLWLPMYVSGLQYPTWNRVANDNGYVAGHQFPVDVNGDGKADWMWLASTGWHVALSTGNGFANPKFALSIDGPTGGTYNSNGYQFPGDFNGDGKTDWMYNRDGWWVALSLGTTFDPPRRWLSNDGPSGTTANLTLQFATDLNGDGKTDWMYKRVDWYVALSTGSGFTSPRKWLAGEGPGGPTGNSGPHKSLGDFNGDGRTDMMYLRAREVDIQTGGYVAGTGFWYVVLSTGNAFTDPVAWLPQIDTEGHCTCNTGEQSVGDFNGDGKSDWLYLSATGWHVATSSPMGNLLASVTNGLGGTSTISYRPSTVYPNTNLPFPVQTVSSVTSDDGRGTTSTTTYSYSGGYAYRPDKEFRGFARTIVSGPPGANGERTITTTSFHQGNDTTVDANDPNVPVGYMKGRPYRVRVTDGDGRLYSEVTTVYAPDDTAPHFNPPLQVDSSVCDAGPCTKQTRVIYTYDEYGNVIREDQYGDLSIDTDDRTIVKTYSPNDSYWIIGLPSAEAIYRGIGTTNKVAATEFYYDGVNDCDQASTNPMPTKGNLTRVVRWLDGGASPETRMAYDSYGNLTCSRDASGNVTRTTMDSSFTFPTVVTNAKGHQTVTQYYGIDGVPTDTGLYGQQKSVTDANGQVARGFYDVFGRKVQELALDGGQVVTQYAGIGTVASQRIVSCTAETPSVNIPTGVTDPTQTCSATNLADVLWAENYVDGLGRTYMARTEGPAAGKVIRQDTAYDQRGKVTTTSLPFFEGAETPRYNTADYDAVGRTIRTKGPDGTIATAQYAGWSITAIDPNGRQRKTSKDAAGRVVQVDEYWDDLTVPYATTTYRYDVLGNLVEVRDTKGNLTTATYDSLSRKVAMSDPDMGTWTYAYDANGNLARQTDARGQTTTFTYDPLNRVKSKLLADQTQVVYTYDGSAPNGIGRLASVQDTSGNVTFQYDAMGRTIKSAKVVAGIPLSEQHFPQGYITQTDYDVMGRVVRITYPKRAADTAPAPVVTYTYNQGGLLSAVCCDDNGKKFAAYADDDYTAFGQPKSVVYGNANPVKTEYTYRSDNNRLERIKTGTAIVTYQLLDYTFDNIGNIASIQDGQDVFWGDRTFAYDPLHRLTQATYQATSSGGSATSYTYGYDAIGNMTSKGQGGSSRLEESAASITYSAPPAAPVSVDDASPALAYTKPQSGGWKTETDSKASGGSYTRSDRQGDMATFVFSGTGVQWLATKTNDSGLAQVYLDGVFQQEVNLACANCGGGGSGGGGGGGGSSGYQQMVWSVTGLANSTHVLDVVVKNSCGNCRVSVDAFIVTGSTTRIEDTSPLITFAARWDSSRWEMVSQTAASGGGLAATNEADALVTFRFEGTGVRWLAAKSSEGFRVDAYVDGVLYDTVDLKSAASGGGGGGGGGGSGWSQIQFQQIVWTRSDLAPGSHLLRLVVAPGQSKTGSRVCSQCVGGFNVDAIEVLPAGQSAWVRHEETAQFMAFGTAPSGSTGGWTIAQATTAVGGSYHSGGNNAQVSYTFAGYAITWVAPKNATGGIAQVYLDGVYQQNVDLYSPTALAQQPVWSKTNLANTQHTLTIVATGTKSGASSGTSIYVDAFWVYNAIGWTTFPDGLASGGSVRAVDLRDSTAIVTFTGTGISWLANMGPTAGNVTVALDNGTPKPISLKAPVGRSQQIAYTVGGLANASHTLTIRVTSNGTTTSPSRVTIDAFDVVGAPLVACAYTDTNHVHAVTQCGSETMTYDQVGNMKEHLGAAVGTQKYDWDAQNRLIKATVGSVTTLFGYDGDGGRVTKATPNATTVYIGELYECTSVGCVRYIFAGSQRIAMKTVSGGTLYYHTDHLGSSTVITDETGEIVQAVVYEPYGRTRANFGATDVHHKFTGQELDDSTGLYHYNARYYDPALGRFISADTIVPDPSNPQSLNRYAYTRNNPLLYTDPSGHCEIVCITVIVLVSAAANAIQAGMNSGWDMQAMLTGAVIGAVSGAVGGAAGVGVSNLVGGGLAGAILGGAAGGLVGSTTSAVLYSAAGYDVNIGMAALAGLGAGAAGGLGGFMGGPALAAVAGGAAGTAISGGDFGAGFVIGVAAAVVTAAIVSQSSSDTAAAPSPEKVAVAEAEASTVDLGPKGTPGGELIETSGSPLRVAGRDQSQGIDGDPIPKECIECHAQGRPGERGPRSPGAGIQDDRPDYDPKDPYNNRGCDTCAPGVPAPPKVLPDGTVIMGGQQHL